MLPIVEMFRLLIGFSILCGVVLIAVVALYVAELVATRIALGKKEFWSAWHDDHYS